MRVLQKLEQQLVGAVLEDVVRRDHSWSFYFTSGSLEVEQLWRLLDGGAFIVTDREDGLTFGGPSAVDAESIARGVLMGRRVIGALIDPDTADLTISFERGARLDMRTTSARYEAWHFDAPDFLVAAIGGKVTEPALILKGSAEA